MEGRGETERRVWHRLARGASAGAALLLALVVSCGEVPPPAERALAVYPEALPGEPEVRILVADGLERAELSLTGPYRLVAEHLDGRPERVRSDDPVTVTVAATGQGVRLGAHEKAEVARGTVEPLGGTRVLLDGTEVFGRIEFRRASGVVPTLRVVAHVPMEQYLVGVVTGEAYSAWPAEALRAQAVAARSMALYRMETRTDRDFDLHMDVRSQVWRPSRRPDPRVVMAVNSTRGVVVTDSYRLFPTFYHSQCGGQTADAQHVFLRKRLLPLSGVRCPYCTEVDPGRWSLTLPRADLSERLRRAGLLAGTVVRLRPLDAAGRETDGSARAVRVAATLADGAVVTLPANEFRLAVGAGRGELQSTVFAVRAEGDAFVFGGRGWGHGVGLCQHGMAWLARERGYGYEDILAYYYPGSLLARLYPDAPDAAP
jgi:stage II sporulation protein D